MARRRISFTAITALALGLMGLGAGCGRGFVAPPTDDGPDAGAEGGVVAGGNPGTTPEESNPNSSCPDQSNIQVLYVNESSAVVTFVEGFRDQNQQSLSSKIVLLRAAGDAGATQDKCITCPWQAGIRNIDFTENAQITDGVPPADLFRGSFKCGDRITFTFKADHSIDTHVETP